jgi:hypothetical protein
MRCALQVTAFLHVSAGSASKMAHLEVVADNKDGKGWGLALVHTTLVLAKHEFRTPSCATPIDLCRLLNSRTAHQHQELLNRNHGRATRTPWHPRGPLRLGHFPCHLPREVRVPEIRNTALRAVLTDCDSPNMLLSGSRDKTLIIWNLTRDETSYGYPKRSLHGHSHIVSDCVRLP